MKNRTKLKRFFATLRMTSKRAAFTLTELPEAGQYGSKHELSAVAKVEPEARQYAPSPLEGEGWGEGSKRRVAFTLAEVLITLGIIGIVAAMTIPTLTKSIQEKQFTVAARKALSDVNNAYKMMQATDTEFNEIICNPAHTGYCSSSTFGENFKLLAKQFKASQTCFTNNNLNCWECDNGQSNLGNTTPPNYLGCHKYSVNSYSFVDASGRAWYMYYNYENMFLVDTNGFAGPNELGKDRWEFLLPSPMNLETQRGMIVPRFTYNYTFKNAVCPSGDCQYGKVFYYK